MPDSVINTTLAPQTEQTSSRTQVSATAKNSQLTPFLLIAALWLSIYVPGMFRPPLLDDVDTIHAEAAREMLLRHDWVTLYTNGIRYLEKAPLPYWGLAASYSLFGISDWSTRLPMMLGVLVMILATYVFGRRVYGQSAGMWSGVVLATALGPYIFTRFMIPDALVGLWLTLAFYFFLRSLEEETPSRLTCWGLAAACALNVLTKGLIGLVFPVGVVGLYLVLTGSLRRLLKMRLISSTLVFLLIAAPWHVMAALRNPAQGQARGFLWFYFVNEHFLRYLNKRVPPGYDTVPLLIFWGLVLVWLLPWCVFLPQAVRDVPVKWRQWHAPMDKGQRASLLFLLWPFVILMFFSFSTRQEYYTIPALPGLALLVGAWLAKENAAGEPDRRAGRISSAILFALGIVAFVAAMWFLSVSRAPAPGADLADLLKKNPLEYDLSLGHVLDLTSEALGLFRGPLLGAGLSLLLGTGANWVLRYRGRPALGNAVLAVMMVGLLACVHSGFVTFSPILSSQKLAVAIQEHYRPGDIIVVDGQYHEASTLNFYTGVPLHILHEPSGNLWYGSKFPDAPHIFETPESFAALWAGPGRVFLWTDQDDTPVLRGKKSFPLAHSGGKSILTNREP